MARKRSPDDVFRRRPNLRRTLGPLQVHLWYVGREPDGFHRQIYSYKMWDLAWDPETPIFQDHGFMPAIWNKEAQPKVLALLEFLTLTEDDAEESFFDGYTPRQVRWKDERAPNLHQMIMELEIDLEDARSEGRPVEDLFLKKQDWSPRDDE